MTSRPLRRQDPFACEDVRLHYRNVKYQQPPGEWYRYGISQLPRPPLPQPYFSVAGHAAPNAAAASELMRLNRSLGRRHAHLHTHACAFVHTHAHVTKGRGGASDFPRFLAGVRSVIGRNVN